jgi:uncharacterized protein (DUF1684 family)
MINRIQFKFAAILLIGTVLLAFRADTAYEQEIREWKKSRVEGLKSENGWLNLVGLLWLEEGENTFGGSPDNDIIFPKEKSDASLGKIILKDGKVTLAANKDAAIFHDATPVTNLEIFPSKEPIVLSHKSLRWFVIQRGDKYALRVRDLESQQVKHFKNIASYPIQMRWKVKAKFVATSGRKIAITDITGRTADQDSPGKLVFNIKNKEYQLDVIGADGDLFIIFGDETNKKQTYGAGRYLYAPLPDKDGYTYLDFNKAINPPCAFTPYATCPLPPKQNNLAVAITAGEKKYAEH